MLLSVRSLTGRSTTQDLWVGTFPNGKQLFSTAGNVEYEAANVAQIARATVATLSPQHFEETKNKYIYVNSFTLTQNQVLGAPEKATGVKFEVEHKKTEDVANEGLAKSRAAKGVE